MQKKILSNYSGLLYYPAQEEPKVKIIHPIDSFATVEIPEFRQLNQAAFQSSVLVSAKEYKNYSRASKFSIEALQELNLPNKVSLGDPFRIGLYITGPMNIINVDVANGETREKLPPAKAMRQYFHPKFNLNNALALLPGILNVVFKIYGPANSITDTTGIDGVFKKAYLDMKSDYIDLACLMIINLYDEPLFAASYAQIYGYAAEQDEYVLSFLLDQKNFDKSYGEHQTLLNRSITDEIKFDSQLYYRQWREL